MKSPWSFYGAAVLLAALPAALLYQAIFSKGLSTFLHWMLAGGTLSVALGVPAFRRIPGRLNALGSLLIGTEAAIFFLQGWSDLLQNDALSHLAYQILGQRFEGWLPRFFVLFWCCALLFLDSQGWTKVVGFVALSSYFVSEIVRFGLAQTETAASEGLKILVLLPFVWLLLESAKPHVRPKPKSGITSA